MSHRKCCLTFGLAALALLSLASDAAGAQKIKVLLMGGRRHDWKGLRAVISEVLQRTGDFELTLREKLDDLVPESIRKYDLVLFCGSEGNFTGPQQVQGLAELLQGGGGLAGVHATDAFKRSDGYWKLTRGRFTGHGGGSFPVRIEDKKATRTDSLKWLSAHNLGKRGRGDSNPQPPDRQSGTLTN
jgi:type 1 glutamine amidotransferase